MPFVDYENVISRAVRNYILLVSTFSQNDALVKRVFYLIWR